MEAITEELSEYERDRGKPMPSKNHAIIQSRLAGQLDVHYGETYTIMTEVKLDIPNTESNAVPDVAIYPVMAFDPLQDEMKMAQMPLGVIEILSPTQTDFELLEKIEKYFNAGVKSCWLVIPTFRLISVFSDRQTSKTFIEGQLHDPVLNITLDLGRVFR